jgi:hypothetical protein
MAVERCIHGMIKGQCGLCANPNGPHERNYGERGCVMSSGHSALEPPAKQEPQKQEETPMAGICIIEGCDENAVAKGLCKSHWNQWYKGKILHPQEGEWKPAAKRAKPDDSIPPTPKQTLKPVKGPENQSDWVAIEVELPPELYEQLKIKAQADFRDPARQIAFYTHTIIANDLLLS